MRRLVSGFVLAASVSLISAAFAQGAASPATAVCDFDNTKQLAIEYQSVSVDAKKKILGKEVPYDKVWAPGGKPVTMFTNTGVSVGGKDLSAGAYTLFLIPRENHWILVVSKSTDTNGNYDEKYDVVRVPMEVGELSTAEPQFSIYFGHVAPDQCSMRVDLAKVRAWVVFQEKR